MTTMLRSPEQTRARYPDEEGYVERDGVRVFWERYGDGEPTVLLAPTWEIVHSRSWKSQIPYLARHARVVTFDPRGNGRSDRPGDFDAYRRREFAADALAVLDAAGVDRAVVVAWCDMGESLILAAEHPERVAGLVHIGPALRLGEREHGEYPFESDPGTDEGWARETRASWLRDWPGYLEFFFAGRPRSSARPRWKPSALASAARCWSSTGPRTSRSGRRWGRSWPASSGAGWSCSTGPGTRPTPATRSR
jgi:pimeloyl-ACP methyl ester carboxylesterase